MTGRLPADETSKVLDAAAACYLRLGLAKTTAAEIAKAAGISRATLYRRFGSQEDIFFAVLERESEAMAEEAHDYLATFTDPGERLVESIMFSISQMHNRPVHSAIFTGESAAWATQRAIRLAMIRRITARGLRMVMKVAAQDPDGGKPSSSEGLSDEQMADLSDWVLRILMSYASVPGLGDRSPDDIRRQLTMWFLPGVRPFLVEDVGPQ